MRPEVVRPLSCDELLAAVADIGQSRIERVNPAVAAAVTGITHDSRSVLAGDLYVALEGAKFHGIDFLAQALASGATAILTDKMHGSALRESSVAVLVADDPRFCMGDVSAAVYGRPAEDMTTIGVTGTCGKSTTSYFAHRCLTATDSTAGLVGGIAWKCGGITLSESERTTPESPELQALLGVLRDRGARSVAMEVSSHALSLGRVMGMTFDVAVFTNLSHEHQDFHPDMEHYFQAKATLFTPERARSGVVNIDDPYGRRLAYGGSQIPVHTYTTSAATQADWRASEIVVDDSGTGFRLDGPGFTDTPRIRLHGKHNVSNAVAALSAAVIAGVPYQKAVEGLAALDAVPGRMERVDAGQDFLAVVDYAHKPEALSAVLETLQHVTRGRIITVAGCGGGRDRNKRHVMGALAARHSHVVVLTTDNPRDEDPKEILAAMVDGARSEQSVADLHVITNRRRAIDYAVSLAGRGDTVLVAGKGHETHQYVRGSSIPFDDRTVLRSAIQQRRNGSSAI